MLVLHEVIKRQGAALGLLREKGLLLVLHHPEPGFVLIREVIFVTQLGLLNLPVDKGLGSLLLKPATSS